MVTLTRRGLLARAGRLAPLAAAAGMFGRFAVPLQPVLRQGTIAGMEVEQETLPSASSIIYEDANVGYDQGGFLVDRWAGGVYMGAERLGLAVRSIMVRSYGGAVRVMLEPWLRAR